MNSRFCYWSVATGAYSDLLAAMIDSARRVGVREDFHVWTDRPVRGAIVHPAGAFDTWGWLFKLVFLREEVRRLDYDYFVFLDADNWFVRHPGEPGRLLGEAPLHLTLEADLTRAKEVPVWWEYGADTVAGLMHAAGVPHASVYTVNAGMFVVRREAIDRIYALANRFWAFCRQHGVWCVDEMLLAYVMQLLCPRPEAHLLTAVHGFWATDTNGVFANRLPDGRPFRFRGFHRLHDLHLDPAIVHVIRGKGPMLAHARRLAAESQP
jgi:hypothetical protein